MRKLKNEELGRPDLETFKKVQKLPIVVVLDNIRSMNNVGAAFRTSDAFLVEQIALCGITAQPPHREINKTALGATESVEWTYFASTTLAVETLKKEGYEIATVEQADASVSLESMEIDPNRKYALVFGNEVFGVEDAIVEAADICIEIPQHGTKHSLNISVSLGIVVWEFYKGLMQKA